MDVVIYPNGSVTITHRTRLEDAMAAWPATQLWCGNRIEASFVHTIHRRMSQEVAARRMGRAVAPVHELIR